MEDLFAAAAKKGGKAIDPDGEQGKDGKDAPKKLPKGVVLGKDGKPCRSCTPFADWVALTKQKVANPSSSTPTTLPASASTSHPLPTSPPPDCPPDVDTLGRSTWTLLHAISATYPASATPAQQSEMRQFLGLFSKLYPCWVCADDFRAWMSTKGNEPRVEGREGLGRWMCEAHNEVNRKLGKGEFDCERWRERWRDGWADGRCG
ncbi:MAG: augmenter of liver regeneration [Lasallia pustulata]|uniref:Sulfhydryl oxidase n=1 Tax=Lasallia pustulata TaxID=136370 RepID=A0A5M8PVR2_9LECA|nr:MAG: augmenter of liver regeneration [Lasallia pustulata]